MSTDATFNRHGADTVHVSSRTHLAGMFAAVGVGAGVLQVVPDKLYAVPIILSAPTTIDGVYHYVGAAASGTWAQVGIYGVECWSYPVPTRLVSQDSTNIAMRAYVANLDGALGVRVASMTPTYPIGDRRLFWLAATWTASARVEAIRVGDEWPIFGYDPVSFSVPLTHLVTSWPGSATLPNSFPAVFTVPVGSNMPALGVRIVG